MMRCLVVLVMLGVGQFVSPAPASADGGLNFSWSPDGNCVSPLIANQTFACNTNGASFIAVASVTPSPDLPQFYELEAVIGCQSEGPLPAWWQSFNSGSCRETSATLRTTSVAAGGCQSPWSEAPSLGGIGAWQTALFPPPVGRVPPANRLVIRLAYQMATARPHLRAAKEYNAFQLVLDTNHTVDDPEHGVVACAGCATGVTLMLDLIVLTADEFNQEITSPKTSNCITWQSSTAECWHAVPVRNTTWGAIKAFYR